MILTAHQPVYLPWLGLFHKIALADTFVWFDHIQYSKDEFYNRNKIKGANGPITLTVPVNTKGKSFEVLLDEAEIDNSQNWKRDHWKAIQFAYRNAPYWEDYGPFFEDVYKQEWKFLGNLNKHILKQILEWLEIKVKWLEWNDVNPEGEKSGLVLDMCKKVGCSVYIFGGLGENYADKEAFTEAKIIPYFQKYNHPEYSQRFPKQGFVPYLSVIDLLFNEGPKSKEIIMSGNVSREDLPT